MTEQYIVREDGKNGTVEIQGGALVRTVRRPFGKDDVLTIPLRSIHGVHHDRKTFGTDVVTVTAGHTSYEWKVKDAETFVAALNAAIA